MLGSIFIGLSGMRAYSKGLDAISNNVANLNTPGFKFSQLSFQDLLNRNASGSMTGAGGTPTAGAGVDVETGRQSFRQGELRDTGNPLDVAVDGDGFFVIERENELMFTRAGQFEFDKDGALVERSTRAKVLVTGDAAGSGNFNLDPYRVFAPKATTEVSLRGSLARSGTGTETYEFTNLEVKDTGGGKQLLKVKFVRDSTDALKWKAEVTDADGKVVGEGDVVFTADGALSEDTEAITVDLAPEDLTPFSFELKFGEAGSFTGVTSVSTITQSQITIGKQDGKELGTLMQTSFDDRGRITLKYTNGETLTPATLLLAQFTAPEQVRALGAGLFAAFENIRPQLATAQSAGRGRVVGGQLELSNVELTQQFSDLILIQRGFQASSQMASVANEMLQQLLQMSERR